LLILIVSALLVSAARNGDAQSGAAAPPSKPPTIQSHEPTAHNGNDAENRHPPQIIESPFETEIVEALRAIERQQQTARTQDRANEKRWWPPSPSWAIVYVTVVYVIVAICQWSGIRRQANIAERALTADKIPYVYMLAVDRPTYLSRGDTHVVQIKYRLKNYGGGPAFLRSNIAQVQIAERLSEIPHSTPREPRYSSGHIIGSGEETEGLSAHPHTTTMSVDDFRFLEYRPEAKSKIFFVGLVNYLDVWGNEWTTGFAWIWDPAKPAMRIATKYEVPDGYNYRRQEQSKSKTTPPSYWRRLIRI
jgi:hypothetical protein